MRRLTTSFDIRHGTLDMCLLYRDVFGALLPTRTSATLLTPLSAMTRFPSGVAFMFLTTPPPPGIAQLWNFSDLISNRTRTFGRIADSTYQIAPFRYVIPYGWVFGPLGEGQSLTSPVFGSSRPRYPRE